jgi:catechol 2,3-dioxygenase-like lactoylglutathione lyase family enzyme
MVTAIRAIVHSSPSRADLVRFYREGLGLGDPDHLHGEELFQVGDLHLGVNSGDSRLRGPVPRVSITFVVDDLDEQVAHLKSLGIPFDLEPTQDSNGTRRAVCRDPDGNLVTLLSGPRAPGSRRDKGDDGAGWGARSRKALKALRKALKREKKMAKKEKKSKKKDKKKKKKK